MKKHPGQHRGFTLIEALAAIAVLTILIPVLLHGFTISLWVAQSTRQTADATALAQSTMDEIIATAQWQNSNGLGSSTTLNGTDYQWDAVLGTWPDDATVQTLTVNVHWAGHGNSQNLVSLMCLVYVPGTATQSGSTLGTGVGTLGGGTP